MRHKSGHVFYRLAIVRASGFNHTLYQQIGRTVQFQGGFCIMSCISSHKILYFLMEIRWSLTRLIMWKACSLPLNLPGKVLEKSNNVMGWNIPHSIQEGDYSLLDVGPLGSPSSHLVLYLPLSPSPPPISPPPPPPVLLEKCLVFIQVLKVLI